ncbi:MAG: ABC transporter permease [Bacteroidota bacterium]
MLLNYLKVAWRNLTRYKVFSFINITGLTAGIAICLILFVHVKDELSFDQFHDKADRIYRLQYNILDFNIARTPPPIAQRMTDYFPEVEVAARLFGRSVSVGVAEGNNSRQIYEEERVFFADSTLLDILSFDIVQGNVKNPLDEPFSVILNEQIAQKYFGNENPIGQTLRLEGEYNFKVVAVARDFPTNSHWHFNMIMPYQNMFDLEASTNGGNLRSNLDNNWLVSHSYTYVLLHPNQNPAHVNERFPDFLAANMPENMERGQAFVLQPLLDIRLRGSEIGAGIEAVGDITQVYLFIGIGLMTLLIACINFINLSTARALQRIKEVGMRKVMGAWRGQLVAQLLGESLFVCLIGFVFGFTAAIYLLPEVNVLTGKTLTVQDFLDPITMVAFLGLFIITGILAGVYPAFYIAKFKPVAVLKGRVADGQSSGFSLRKVLVVFQFTIAIILITGTVVIQDQLNMFRNRPLGFQKESIITIPLFSSNFNNAFGGMTEELRNQLNTFEDQLEDNPRIVSSTLSSNVPGLGAVRRNVLPDGRTADESVITPSVSVDYDFVESFGLELVLGRDFSRSYGTDHTNAFIVNEQAIEKYEWGSAEAALGKTLNLEGKSGQVVGVVKDFHFESLRGVLDALVLDVNPGLFTTLSVKVEATDLPQTISFLEEKWNEFFPQKAFDYEFLDEQIAEIYSNEENLANIITYFAFLAILISCLGSYGLIMFLAQQKMKEIGIRKVLGASVPNIISLLAKGFAVLLGVAFVISVPLAYWLLDLWLSDFVFRVSLGVDMFLIAGLITFGIVAITISYQSLKAAFVNPANILRSE